MGAASPHEAVVQFQHQPPPFASARHRGEADIHRGGVLAAAPEQLEGGQRAASQRLREGDGAGIGQPAEQQMHVLQQGQHHVVAARAEPARHRADALVADRVVAQVEVGEGEAVADESRGQRVEPGVIEPAVAQVEREKVVAVPRRQEVDGKRRPRGARRGGRSRASARRNAGYPYHTARFPVGPRRWPGEVEHPAGGAQLGHQLRRLLPVFAVLLAPDEGDAELLQPPPFASLDADCLRFVAACLPRRRLNFPINSECLDARSPSLVAMASASKFLREALKSLMAAMRRAHEARIDSLAAFARDAGTSWGALGRAGDLFRSRGSGQCASCGGCYPKSGGLFLREEEGAAARDEAAERPADLRLAAGLCHCAHCWRTAFGRSARENTWEGPA
eukprot:gene9473-biopygen4646